MDVFARLPQELADESARNFELLNASLSDSGMRLVPFVGAGVSSAGVTRLPAVPQLLDVVLSSIVVGDVELSRCLPRSAVEIAAGKLGFEVAMSHLQQTVPGSVPRVIEALRNAEESRTPNRCHEFLATWLKRGGSAITTNYDRFIERARPEAPVICYQDTPGERGFEEWKARLASGGCLFKVHGSFDDLGTCLAALDDVRTELVGDRADLVQHVIREHPVCFIGWRGADPDIPPRISQAFANRDPDLPLFWVVYPGPEPESATRDSLLQGIPSSLRALASLHPIFGDADALAAEVLQRWGVASSPSVPVAPAPGVMLDSGEWEASPSGRARFVGIALRLVGEAPTALQVFDLAAQSARDDAERWAAETETALTLWDSDQRAAAKAGQQRSADGDEMTDGFGAFSMSVVRARGRPWRLAVVIRTRRAYRKAIERQRLISDPRAVALHESLFQLYEGKWRLAVAGRLGKVVPLIRAWILSPFLMAGETIDRSGDVHLHGRIDVLVGRALAMAELGDCTRALETIAEVDRLIQILRDEPRRQHWQNQRSRLKRMCALAEEQP